MSRAAFVLAVLTVAGGSAGAAEAPPALRTAPPAWAADAVWYEIVPERFRNGDPRNDPRSSDLRGSAPVELLRDWMISPWASDWYKLQPWEKASGRGFYELAPVRRYGGDLQGILDRLDYIQSLGVNAICLTPVFEAPSLHKRDATYLHHVDNNFGPDPENDRLVWATENPGDTSTWKWTAADKMLLRLVQECHRRQMKVILDGVFHQVGPTFWAFRDARARGAQSRYASWFAVTRFDDPRTPGDELAYETIDGAPVLRREGDTLSAGLRDHLRAIVRRWGDPNGDGDPSDGIDGWRVVAPERLGRGFLRELRRWVLGVNPEALLAGELLWQDREGNKMWTAAPWLHGDQLDAVTNYRFADAAKAFFLDRQGAIPSTELDARLAALRADHRPEVADALISVLDSHQTDRLASQAVNPDRPYDQQRSPAHDPTYDARAPRGEEWKRLRLLAAFQFASPGAPILYYGTEAGMWGADDPDCLKPMLWSDQRYESEATHPLGQPRRSDNVRFDDDLFKYYQTLGRLRAALPPLRRGTFETVLTDDPLRLFAFARVLDQDRVVAAFNASDRELTAELPFAGPARDQLSGRRYRPQEGKVSVAIPPVSAVLLAADAR